MESRVEIKIKDKDPFYEVDSHSFYIEYKGCSFLNSGLNQTASGPASVIRFISPGLVLDLNGL